MNLRAIEWKILVPTDARISNCQQYPARQTPTTRQALKSLRSAKTKRVVCRFWWFLLDVSTYRRQPTTRYGMWWSTFLRIYRTGDDS
jgi:hypothetical protein